MSFQNQQVFALMHKKLALENTGIKQTLNKSYNQST